MRIRRSSMAVLCYFVTVLLLYLIGDVLDTRWLQFAKGSGEQRSLQSLFPLLLAMPVYVFVYFKTKRN